MTIRSVKNTISNMNDCKPYINYPNMLMSEPIMTKDEHNHIIDNFFMFSRYMDNNQNWFVNKPSIYFSVDLDYKEVITRNSSNEHITANSYLDSWDENWSYTEDKKIYDFAYPFIRRMYANEIRKDKKLINNYLDALKHISGRAVYHMYKVLYPDFFNWALET